MSQLNVIVMWMATVGSPSLEQIARNIAENSLDHVNIMIKTVQLQLRANITFSSFESLTISGDPDLNTTISCQGGNLAGLVFSDLATLTIRKLTVMHCGALLNTYSSAVAILQGRDVTVESLVVLKSKGNRTNDF